MFEQSLEQVVQAFALWRQQKTNSRNRIPFELQQQAVNLLGLHNMNKVAKALNVSHAQIKKWCQQLQSGEIKVSATEQEAHFLALPVLPSHQASVLPLELELILPNSSQVRIRGELSSDLLRALVQEAKCQ